MTDAAPACDDSAPAPGPLQGLRVLEVSRRFGHYCGKLMADLGAEVILVEPPRTGVPLRAEPPFIDGRDDGESAIPHLYLDANKRSITIDLGDPDGQALLRRLALDADLVLEDEPPGLMAARGLDYARLAQLNPRIVVTSITPFGQTGPSADDEACDLTLLARGGLLGLMGFPDTAPTRAAGDQAHAMGCMYAAVGSMLALLEAQSSGLGQHVDVSVQECVVMALENAAQLYDLEGRVRERAGIEQRYAGSGIFECADGHVYVFAGGMAAARFWGHVVQWMLDEAVPDAMRLQSPQWQDMRYVNSAAAKEVFEQVFGTFARSMTKAALHAEAQRRRIPLCPVSTPADIAASRQLEARGFFSTLPPDAGLPALRMPGAPYQLSATPWSLRNRAPRLGEHTAVILEAAGVDATRRAELAARGVI